MSLQKTIFSKKFKRSIVKFRRADTNRDTSACLIETSNKRSYLGFSGLDELSQWNTYHSEL